MPDHYLAPVRVKYRPDGLWLEVQDRREQFELGMGSALSVLLFLSVLLIAYLLVRLFRVDLAAARREA